jgi:mono/diheme cytochrome c family protein
VAAGCGASASQPSAVALFNRDCETCHSITGHAARRQQGGDLKDLDLPRPELVQYAAEMPVLHKPLTAAQVQELADYLQRAERGR